MAVKTAPRSFASVFRERFQEIEAESLASKPLWPAPYNEYTAGCAKLFVRDLVYSYEETSGETMKAPDEPYLFSLVDEWFDTKTEGRMLAVTKSRRLWVTWLFCALDVWDCGMRRIGVAMVGNTDDKANDFVYRCWFIYDQIRKNHKEWDLPEPKPWGGNLAMRRIAKVGFANGSLIEGLHADSANGEVLRSTGYARVRLEELSSYRSVGTVASQAAAVTTGPPAKFGEPRKPGGHIVAASNASANDEYHEQIDPPAETHPAFPYGAYDSEKGNRCVRIHYKADRNKTPAWISEERKRGWSERDWRREMELDDTIYDGVPVFEDFIDAIHCPGPLKTGSWELVPGSTYVLGMDAGQTQWPGAVLLEISAGSLQVAAVQEWTFNGDTPMSRAIPLIMDGYEREFAGKKIKYRGLKQVLPGMWDEVEWVADPTVTTRDGTTGNTAQRKAWEFGVRIVPMSQSVDLRLNAVDWLLTNFYEPTIPRFYICGKDCPMLLKALQGAYKCMDVPGKPAGHDRRLPEKNVYSHIADGFQYAALRTKDLILKHDGQRPKKKRQR